MSGAQRVLDVPQGQAGQGCSRANRDRKVTLTLQRHSGSRWNKNEQNLRGRSEDGKAGVPGRGFSFLSICNVNGLLLVGFLPAAFTLVCGRLLVVGLHSHPSPQPTSPGLSGPQLRCCHKPQALGSLDGFFKGRSPQLLQRNIFTLLFCILP